MSTSTLAKREKTVPSLFSDFLRPFDSWFDGNGGFPKDIQFLSVPAANILENKEEYTVSLAVPGMKKDNFTIDVEGDLLIISGESKEKNEEKGEKYKRQEFNYSSFTRSFPLPSGVNKDKIDASYEKGLLKLVLPKTEEAKKLLAKHIPVK